MKTTLYYGGKCYGVLWSNFIDDEEKMKDFVVLTKDEFLQSYSYLTEEEYDNTMKIWKERNL